MEDGTNLYEDNAYITYFDALYLLNIVFKNDSKYAFIDSSHVEGIWSNEKDKYHKFCKIKAFKYELGGFVIQIDDEYKGASEELMPLSTNIKNSYNPFITSESPTFKKAYWARRDNALSTFVDGDENINEHYFIAGFTEKYDYEHQKLLGLNTPYINFVINNDKS